MNAEIVWQDWPEVMSTAQVRGLTLRVQRREAGLWWGWVNGRDVHFPAAARTADAAKRYCEQAAARM